VDPRVIAALGEAVFRSDVLAVSGLDDRSGSQGILQEAERLMVDAVDPKLESVRVLVEDTAAD